MSKRCRDNYEAMLVVIDRLLLRKVRIDVNGQEREITVLEAILHQLML